jgi:O-succinylbenzoate synthase
MIIKSIELYQFQLPLNRTLNIARQNLTSRDGLILKISDEENNQGLGEISPLPGLHKENLSHVIKQIKKHSSFFINRKIPNIINQIGDGFETFFKNLSLFPSVQFGLESAILSLIAAKQGISITDLFVSSLNQSILVNALLTGKPEQILKKTNHYLKEGFVVFKLKVGRNTIDNDISFTNKICSLLNSKAKLRLDVNQAWSLSEALQFFQNIDVNKIEFIEEPLTNFNELQALFNKTNIPIALDENISKISIGDDISLSFVKAAVIKPTVIGSINKSIKLIRYAENNDIIPVISDTFQSGVGLSMLITIAATIKNKNIAMGFDTYSWLKEDILINNYQINQGKLYFENINKPTITLNYPLMQKL